MFLPANNLILRAFKQYDNTGTRFALRNAEYCF